MADNVIKVSVTSTKSQRVSVSSSQQATNITASPDTGRFWSQNSKNWAVSENIVDGEDYSSKYYANKSKGYAQNAESYLETTRETYNSFVTDANDYRSELTELKDAGAVEINEAIASGKDEINSTKTTIINDIEFVADGEKKEIQNLADEIKDSGDIVNAAIEAGVERLNSIDSLKNNQITNCITEIPQRIKYTLEDGTLTIKAGSVVIVPYGTEDKTSEFPVGSMFLSDDFKVYDTQFEDGKFFVWAQLQKDIMRNSFGSASADVIFYIDNDGTVTNDIGITSYHYSGETEPTQSGSIWYDTVNNIVKANASGSWLLPNSLPIGSLSRVNGVATSVNQVFNGMGYIGSTVWVDKGVKGLIPNGRNEDGSLKNIGYTTDKVITFTNTSWTGLGTVLLGINYLAIWSSDDYHYNEELNTTKYRDNTTTSKVAKIGNCTLTSGVISNFQPKLPIRLATTDMVDGQWVDSYKYISQNVLNAGTYNLDLSSYLPQDNNVYEILVKILITNTKSGDNAYISIRSDIIYSDDVMTAGSDNNLGGVVIYNSSIIPACKYLTMIIVGSPSVTGVELFGYRRIGTNI